MIVHIKKIIVLLNFYCTEIDQTVNRFNYKPQRSESDLVGYNLERIHIFILKNQIFEI